MTKSIFASKTLWVNTISLVATGTGFFAGALTAHPDLVCWLVLIQAAANIVLRFMTKEPVSVVSKKPQSDVATST
ncbi:MAG: hypothetical protein WC315_03765 [Candidatus Omnitrophota bacterium]|jgi:hypothetical protein